MRAIDRVVLDTNVIVSGAMSPDGASARLFDIVVREKVILTCEESLAELRDVFARDKVRARIDIGVIETFVAVIEAIGTKITITGERNVVDSDPDDNVFIELAELGQADCLVSADTDLLALRSVGLETAREWDETFWTSASGDVLPIIRPSELLAAINAGEAR